ncbi:hypothetical protein C1645_826821 [Glomus cerebriforme]|uniref:Uncharacterized protein n=1 Tax=Glomus cerebriforme TaxID=658196 RepID=A0A397SVS0_9GLOM|nr:hypothetical protein C1645_826821 [Glomus cerebriforme]
MSGSDIDTTVTRSSITRSSVSTSHGRKKRKHNARSVAASDNNRPTPTIAGRANQNEMNKPDLLNPDEMNKPDLLNPDETNKPDLLNLDETNKLDLLNSD